MHVRQSRVPQEGEADLHSASSTTTLRSEMTNVGLLRIIKEPPALAGTSRLLQTQRASPVCC